MPGERGKTFSLRQVDRENKQKENTDLKAEVGLTCMGLQNAGIAG